MVKFLPVVLITAFVLCAQSESLEFQTMDGSRNNKENPHWGSAGSPYLRIINPQYGPNQEPSGRNRPNPRIISNVLFSRKPFLHNKVGLSDFMPAWGVMLHLDITLAPRNKSDVFSIPVPLGDPIFDPTGSGDQSIAFLRTQFIGTDNRTGARIHQNAFTSFIDCSGLYGNSVDEMNTMRLFSGGLLKYEMHGELGEFPEMILAGDNPGIFAFNSPIISMMPHLATTYIVFFREHNRRARQLAQRHPDWNDEQIFQRARRWVIAVVQKTTLYFYLPSLIGTQIEMYSGYNSSINPSVDLFFANVAYRYGHSAVNSFILRIDENGNQAAEGHLILRNAFFGDICSEIRKYGVESILRGFAAQNDQNVDTTFVDDIRNHLPLAGPGGHFDLSAIGIQRTRELGIPDYNTCRKAFNLTTAKYWSDVTSNIQLQRQLSNLYPNIDDADVYVAAFVEDHTDANSAVGPLMRKSIMDQFTRLRDGDRFWYEAPGILTTEEHAELLNFTYGTMIQMNTKISHFPSDPFVAVHPSYFANGIQQAKKASQKAYGSGSVSVLGNLQLSWTIQSDISVIDFIFESNSSGWYGFGLGSNMLGAEIFFCTDSGNGSFTVIDSWSTQTQPPPSDISQGGTNDVFNIMDITNSQGYHSRRVVKFSRKLNTGDQLDAVIVPGVLPVIFAYSDDIQTTWHGPQRRISALLDFYSSGESTVILLSNNLSLKILHGISMYISFVFIYPYGIFVARYYSVGRWLLIHQTLMGAVTTNVLITALTAFIGGYGNSRYFHSYIGYAVVGLVVVVVSLGFISANMVSSKYASLISSIHWMHRCIGLVLYITGICNGYLGICDITIGFYSAVYLPKLYITSAVLFPTALLINGWCKLREQQHHDNSKESHIETHNFNILPSFSWDEINDRVCSGYKWIIINAIIYDIANFMDNHPGGSAILMNALGIDASHLFSGGSDIYKSSDASYSESRTDIHIHSRFAQYILSKMAVGKVLDSDINYDTSSSSSSSQRGNTLSSICSNPVYTSLGRMSIKTSISPSRYRLCAISLKSEITEQSDDAKSVWKIQVALPNQDDEVNFKPGENVNFQFIDCHGQMVTRSYTPIRCKNIGTLDFLIRHCHGEMTNYLMGAGSVRVKGPVSTANQILNHDSETYCWRSVNLIASGTGITPMLLFIDYHLLHCQRDSVTNRPSFDIRLLFINPSARTIPGLKELSQLEANAQGCLRIFYLIQKQETEDFGVKNLIFGQLSESIIQSSLHSPSMISQDDAHLRSNIKGCRDDGMKKGQSEIHKRKNLVHESDLLLSPKSTNDLHQYYSYHRAYLPPLNDQSGSNDTYPLMTFICGGPKISNLSTEILRKMGYQNVFTL